MLPVSTCHDIVICPQWRSAIEGSPLHLACLPVGEISSRNLHNPLLTLSVSHSIFSTHTTDLFLPYSCACTFLEMTKPKGPKRSRMFMRLQCENGQPYIHHLWWDFLPHADRTPVAIRPNTMVLNEVKDKSWYQPQPQALILTPNHATYQTPDTVSEACPWLRMPDSGHHTTESSLSSYLNV